MAIATIPSKNNINRESGAIVLTLSRGVPLREKGENLLRVGDFLLKMEADSLTLENERESLKLPSMTFYGPTTTDELAELSLSGKVMPGETYRVTEGGVYEEKTLQRKIMWTWIGDNHRLLIYDQVNRMISTVTFEKKLSGDFGIIELAVEPYWTGKYQSLEIYGLDFLYNEPNWYDLEDFFNTAPRLFDADYTSPNHYVKEPIIETTMIPNDQSPILVESESGPMVRQYFFDHETGEYQKTNTETFLYRKDKVIHLSYDELDPNYRVKLVFENGESFIAPHLKAKDYAPKAINNFYTSGNAVYFDLTEEQAFNLYGQKVEITYQLDNSYTVEYNEDAVYDSLKIHLVNHKDNEVSVIQEGNRFSNQRLAKEVDLNPFLNPQHTGFLYIDKEPQRGQAFRLNTSSPYVVANGTDTADFTVELMDQEGNEVLNPEIDVYVLGEDGRLGMDLGSLHPIINRETLKARNVSGRCHFKYRAPFIQVENNPITQRIFLVAFDRGSGLGAQIPLYIRPTHQESSYNTTVEAVSEAALPFEMFARYFNRELKEGTIINDMDFNGNGMLDWDDFETLNRLKTNLAEMNSLESSLILRLGINSRNFNIDGRLVFVSSLNQTYIIES